MPEWLKILVTSLASFTIGVVSEPVRAILAEQARKFRMRRSLYRHLSFLRGLLNRGIEEHLRGNILMATLDQIDVTAYEQYRKDDPKLFLELRDSWGLKRAFESIRLISLRVQTGDMEEVISAILATLESLDRDIEYGYLDKRLLTSLSPENLYPKHPKPPWK